MDTIDSRFGTGFTEHGDARAVATRAANGRISPSVLSGSVRGLDLALMLLCAWRSRPGPRPARPACRAFSPPRWRSASQAPVGARAAGDLRRAGAAGGAQADALHRGRLPRRRRRPRARPVRHRRRIARRPHAGARLAGRRRGVAACQPCRPVPAGRALVLGWPPRPARGRHRRRPVQRGVHRQVCAPSRKAGRSSASTTTGSPGSRQATPARRCSGPSRTWSARAATRAST